MTEKKSRDRVRSAADEVPPEGPRDSFLHTFFKKGAQLTEELLHENERLRQRVLELDGENAALRTQLASDEAIRDALLKIEQLEREKRDLLSRVSEAATMSTRTVQRFQEVENDLADLANLYVASDHLHSTLELPRVVNHIGELLEQLVGARSHAIYFLDQAGARLVPIAAHGIDRERLPAVPLRAQSPADADPDPATLSRVGAIERAYLTAVPIFDPEVGAARVERPAACVPLVLDGRAVGVVVVYALFAQKKALTALDHELFRMLGAHAATAITGALLWAEARQALPAPP